MAALAVDNKVLLGKVHGLFGVRGWVKVYSYTRPMENLLDYGRWFLVKDASQTARLFRVLNARVQGKTLVAQLADETNEPLADRDAAAGLLEAQIYVAREDMPPLPEGQYYWQDLLGLEVVNRQGEQLGQVSQIMETGASDVLVVKGEQEHLIPFVVGVYVDEVDSASQQLRVDWERDY